MADALHRLTVEWLADPRPAWETVDAFERDVERVVWGHQGSFQYRCPCGTGWSTAYSGPMDCQHCGTRVHAHAVIKDGVSRAIALPDDEPAFPIPQMDRISC